MSTYKLNVGVNQETYKFTVPFIPSTGDIIEFSSNNNKEVRYVIRLSEVVYNTDNDEFMAIDNYENYVHFRQEKSTEESVF